MGPGNWATEESRPRHLRKERSASGQTSAPGSVVKCEECHVIILDTVQCAV